MPVDEDAVAERARTEHDDAPRGVDRHIARARRRRPRWRRSPASFAPASVTVALASRWRTPRHGRARVRSHDRVGCVGWRPRATASLGAGGATRGGDVDGGGGPVLPLHSMNATVAPPATTMAASARSSVRRRLARRARRRNGHAVRGAAVPRSVSGSDRLVGLVLGWVRAWSSGLGRPRNGRRRCGHRASAVSIGRLARAHFAEAVRSKAGEERRARAAARDGAAGAPPRRSPARGALRRGRSNRTRASSSRAAPLSRGARAPRAPRGSRLSVLSLSRVHVTNSLYSAESGFSSRARSNSVRAAAVLALRSSSLPRRNACSERSCCSTDREDSVATGGTLIFASTIFARALRALSASIVHSGNGGGPLRAARGPRRRLARDLGCAAGAAAPVARRAVRIAWTSTLSATLPSSSSSSSVSSPRSALPTNADFLVGQVEACLDLVELPAGCERLSAALVEPERPLARIVGPAHGVEEDRLDLHRPVAAAAGVATPSSNDQVGDALWNTRDASIRCCSVRHSRTARFVDVSELDGDLAEANLLPERERGAHSLEYVDVLLLR